MLILILNKLNENPLPMPRFPIVIDPAAIIMYLSTGKHFSSRRRKKYKRTGL